MRNARLLEMWVEEDTNSARRKQENRCKKLRFKAIMEIENSIPYALPMQPLSVLFLSGPLFYF